MQDQNDLKQANLSGKATFPVQKKTSATNDYWLHGLIGRPPTWKIHPTVHSDKKQERYADAACKRAEAIADYLGQQRWQNEPADEKDS